MCSSSTSTALAVGFVSAWYTEGGTLRSLMPATQQMMTEEMSQHKNKSVRFKNKFVRDGAAELSPPPQSPR